MYTDTGGGFFLYGSGAERLGLSITDVLTPFSDIGIPGPLNGGPIGFCDDVPAETSEAIRIIGGTAPVVRVVIHHRSIFDRWRQSGWRVVPKGEAYGNDLIEVPSVGLAGFDIGPVWFARRPDGNFTRWMSQWIDRQIVGAIGGNVFRTCRMALNYPTRSATF